MKSIIVSFICCMIPVWGSLRAQCHPDIEALQAIYEATNGANWIDNTGWEVFEQEAPPLECDPCRWYGIHCNDEGRVTCLDLYRNNLEGSIPAGISGLENLEYLNLSNNHLTGRLPSSITRLSELEELLAFRNQLSGVLPQQIGRMSQLQRLELWENNLSGVLPVTLRDLTQIRVFSIAGNQFSGCIPEDLNSWCAGGVSVDMSNNPGLPEGGNFEQLCAAGAGWCSTAQVSAFDAAYFMQFDRKLYEEGEGLALTLHLDPAFEVQNEYVLVASPATGDVEALPITASGEAGVYITEAIVRTATNDPAVAPTPNDGVLNLEPNEMFTAVYYPEENADYADGVPPMIYDVAVFRDENFRESSFEIREELALLVDESAPNEAEGEKASATIIGEDGFPLVMATRELIIAPVNQQQLDMFLEKTNGAVLARMGEGEAMGDTDAKYYLVRVQTDAVEVNDFAQLRSQWGGQGDIYASNEEAIRLMTLMYESLFEGYMVMPNTALFPAGDGAPVLSSNAPGFFDTPAGALRSESFSRSFTHERFDLPKVWSYMALFDFDERRIPVAFLDQGFAPNNDFREGFLECNMTLLGTDGTSACGPGRATSVSTVGNSLFGSRGFHGNGVVSVAGAVLNNGEGVIGTGGQVVVPHLYRYLITSYVFGIGGGIRAATDNGATVVNISASYPCQLRTNLFGWDMGICNPGERALACASITAALAGAQGALCAIACSGPWAPFACPICLTEAAATVTAVSTACLALTAAGDVKDLIEEGVQYALDRGVTVVACAGNRFSEADFDPALSAFISFDQSRMTVEDWDVAPASIPGVITVGAIDPGDPEFRNVQIFGDRVDIWAPIYSAYYAPSEPVVSDPPEVIPSFGGTSAAAPYIAGLIANMQAINPTLDPRESRDPLIPGRIRRLLQTTAYTNEELSEEFGIDNPNGERGLLVNPFRLMEAVADPLIPDYQERGYNYAFNADEAGSNNDFDNPDNTSILSTSPPRELSGAIVTFNSPEGSSHPAVRDVDWYRWQNPDFRGSYHSGWVELIYPSAHGELTIDRLNFNSERTEGDETIKRFDFPRGNAGSSLGFVVRGVGDEDNLYKLRFGPALPSGEEGFGGSLPWVQIGRDQDFEDIAAIGSDLYALGPDGTVFKSITPLYGSEWDTFLDDDIDNTQDIAADACYLFRRTTDDRQSRTNVNTLSTFTADTDTPLRSVDGAGRLNCEGFPIATLFGLFGNNLVTASSDFNPSAWVGRSGLSNPHLVAASYHAGQPVVFLLRRNNTLWMHKTGAETASGWELLTDNMTDVTAMTAAYVETGGGAQHCIYVLRADRTIWRACIPAGEVDTELVNVSTLENWCPDVLVSGDQEFDGNGPEITVSAEYEISEDRTRIDLVVDFSAVEQGGDVSTVTGTFRNTVFVADEGQRIVRIDNFRSDINFESRPAGPEVGGCNPGELHSSSEGDFEIRHLAGREVIYSAEIIGDTGGNDISDNCDCDTQIQEMQFYPITVHVTER